MSTDKEFVVRESSSTAPRTKKAPKLSAIPVPFVYDASDDGTDENLLILLHGLGAYSLPFFGSWSLMCPAA